MVFLLFDLHMYLWWWKMVVDFVHKLINHFPLNQMIDPPIDWSIGSIDFPYGLYGCPLPPVPKSWIRHCALRSDRTTPVNSTLAGSPWLRTGTRIAYSELKHEANSELTWSAAALLLSDGIGEDEKGREGRGRRGLRKRKGRCTL